MPALLRLRGQPQPDSSFRATNPIVRRINRLFPAGQEKKRLQRRKITQPDFDTIACPPNFLKIIQAQLSHRFAFGGMKPAEFRGSTACRSICGANTAQLVRRYILTDLDVHRFDVVA
jgi:hypothetical protein